MDERPFTVDMVDNSKVLADRIERYCARHEIAPSTFGNRFFGNTRLYKRLRAGGSLRLPTYIRLDRILSEDEASDA
ncbi:MAG: hypothetical protein AAGB02_03040 [Pseudomonadota bacterium]